MFQSVRQHIPLYILDKGENPSLVVATVESVSNPMPRYNSQFAMQPYGGADMVVDITVKVGEETREYKQLPANMSIANFGTSGIVVSDDRAAMCAEVEAFMSSSQKMLDSVPYHKRVVEASKAMLIQLNPQLAKEQAQEDRLNALEGKFDKVMDMLSTALGHNVEPLKTE